MNTRAIQEIINSPLFKALVSDVAVVGSVEAARAMLQANKRAVQLQGQMAEAPMAIPESAELRQALIALKDSGKIKEIAKWIKELSRAHKAELMKWKHENLAELFEFDADVRILMLSAVAGQTPMEELAEIKQWVENSLSVMISKKSKEKLQELDKWAKEVIAKHKQEGDDQ